MVGFREPGYLWKLGIPFVWGPVGGMGLFPWRFLYSIGIYGALFFLGRNIINLFHMRFLIRPKLAARAAGAVGLISATKENREYILRYLHIDSQILSEVGIPGEIISTPLKRHDGEPFRLVWSGLHIPRKALHFGLRALAGITHNIDWRIDVLGDGPLREKWENEARHLNINYQTTFHGRLPREEALRIIASAHVMLITSLADLTSTVTVEAISLGLPVICPNHCGFPDVIDETCGICVQVSNPSDYIRGLTNAIMRLATDEEYRQILSHGAIRRAQKYAWPLKAMFVNEIYQNTLDNWRKPHHSSNLKNPL
jgi:glycosyltransferase involved in cell wall biosynthesis